MNDHTTRRMYTKRAPGDINIYAMNEDLTTQKLSKVEKQRLANKLSYQRNRDKRIKACMDTYVKKRDQLLPLRRDYNKKYYSNNKEKGRPRRLLYYYNNKERILQHNKIQHKLKLKTDSTYRLIVKLRNRMYHVFNRSEFKKCNNTLVLIGCSVEEARHHIERQWLPGMSWGNYSLHGWHIDHIKPINTFNLADAQQQKICFHYTNLRPLWAADNLSRPKNGSDISY